VAMHGDGSGWLGFAALFVAGAALTAPAMRWVTTTPRVALTTADA
jgi:hypothetical protein